MRELLEVGSDCEYRSDWRSPWRAGRVVEAGQRSYTIDAGREHVEVPARNVRAPETTRRAPRVTRALGPTLGLGLAVEPMPAPPPAPRKPPIVRDSIEAIAKAAPVRDRAHLDFVAQLPCAVCTADGPSDPHHFGERGVGMKTDDLRTLPLCRGCHDRFHRTGRVVVGGRELSRLETERLFYKAQIDAVTAHRRLQQLHDARRST